MFGPASRWRTQIVPFDSGETDCVHCPAGKSWKQEKGWDDEGDGKLNNNHSRNYSWSELMLRVFELDVLKCPECGSRMRILCAVNPPDAIRKILDCLGLPSRPPPIFPAVREMIID
jgi:hypothetical protein